MLYTSVIIDVQEVTEDSRINKIFKLSHRSCCCQTWWTRGDSCVIMDLFCLYHCFLHIFISLSLLFAVWWYQFTWHSWFDWVFEEQYIQTKEGFAGCFYILSWSLFFNTRPGHSNDWYCASRQCGCEWRKFFMAIIWNTYSLFLYTGRKSFVFPLQHPSQADWDTLWLIIMINNYPKGPNIM